MESHVKKVSDVEYELEITATSEDLAPDFKAALQRQRGQTQMKGFRPGKVPINLVKKMHGKAIAYGIAEQKVQEVYEMEVLKSDEYDVIGPPTLTQLDYEMDGDLRAVIRFGVRPEVELQDVSGEKISRLKHEVSEEDIEEQIERIRLEHAELVPTEGEEIDENTQVVIDLQRIDEESNTPIIGEKEEDVEFFMDDERLHDELRDELLGRKSGDSFRVDLPHGDDHTHRYEVTVKDTKRRELPELDDAFVGEISKDQFVSVEELREDLRENIQKAWEQRSKEMLDSRIVSKMLELHTVPVPDSAIELYLDSFVEDVKQRNDGKLPDDFDEASFRTANRGEAERQAKWMLIRDAFIKQEGLEVSEEDLDKYFEDAAAQNEQLSAEVIRQYYDRMNMTDRVKQQVLSRKVFERLAEKFEIEDKDHEAFDEEARAAREEDEKMRESEAVIAPSE